MIHLGYPQPQPGETDLFQPLRHWLNRIEFKRCASARWVCRLIPAACPFRKTLNLAGRKLEIPALCELNPVYPEVLQLRFRALSYLADGCGEDVSCYVQ